MIEKNNIREFNVNDPQKSNSFQSNNVHTTKYTPLTFVPYFLIHELSRPANIFFCLIIAIQVIILLSYHVSKHCAGITSF